jgi:hypothetical protein
VTRVLYGYRVPQSEYPRELAADLIVAWCDVCEKTHTHGTGAAGEPGPFHRAAHCASGGGYMIVEDAELAWALEAEYVAGKKARRAEQRVERRRQQRAERQAAETEAADLW